MEPGILGQNWRLRGNYSLMLLASLAGVSPTKVSPYLLQSTSFYHPSTPISSTSFGEREEILGKSAVVRSGGSRKGVRPSLPHSFISYSFRQQPERVDRQNQLRSGNEPRTAFLSTLFIVSSLISEANLKADYERHSPMKSSIPISQNYTSDHLKQLIEFDLPTLQNPYCYGSSPNLAESYGRLSRAIIQHVPTVRDRQRSELVSNHNFAGRIPPLFNSNDEQ